jgi:hypothetical protein
MFPYGNVIAGDKMCPKLVGKLHTVPNTFGAAMGFTPAAPRRLDRKIHLWQFWRDKSGAAASV